MCPNWSRMSASKIVAPTQEQGLCRALVHLSSRVGSLGAKVSALGTGGSDCLKLGGAEQVEFLILHEIGGWHPRFPFYLQNMNSCWLAFLQDC